MAYFDQEVSLSKMVQHIYGNTSVLTVTNRPNMFVKELKMYVDYLKNEIATVSVELTAAQIKKWNLFKNNLEAGIGYYQNLFVSTTTSLADNAKAQYLLHFYKEELQDIKIPELEMAK